MTKWKYGWLVLALLSSSLLGGVVSQKLAPGNVVTAEEFRLVDKEGKLYATLTVTPKGGTLRLYDRTRRIIWQAPDSVRFIPLQKQ